MSLRTHFVLMFGLTLTVAAAPVMIESPGGNLRGTFAVDRDGALVYSVEHDGREIIAPSRAGVAVDGVDLGSGVMLGAPVFGALDESHATLGGKARAHNRARTLRLPVVSAGGRTETVLEARAYDDGFAWRMIVPGAGRRRVNGEVSGWTLPAGSRVWFFERDSDWKLKSYAGEWISARVDELGSVSKQGPVQGAPLVAELSAGGGYVLVTEAALENYSGLRLRATPGSRVVRADFTEADAGFVIDGPITTPWRVTLVAPDLDALVNSDLIANLAPPPDARLFADTSYIKPGRAVWRWWSSGTGTPEQEKQFVDHAIALGFEYTLIDEGWLGWPEPWKELAGIVDYARDQAVGVWVWKRYQEVASPADNWAQLRAFLDAVQTAGAVGVKLDFLNAESKDRIDFATAALRLTAERRLMVIFHGVAKPTGEARTYPNEITREGVRGLELNKMKEGPIPASHNAALPFTRFVVGAGDYTPLSYSQPGPTSWAHQLATFIQFTSPMQIMAEDPEKVLNDPATRPALDVLQSIPAVWDETRVLAPSAIGRLSVMARRSGTTWFLSLLNGDQPATVENPDLSFLGEADYRAVELTSPEPRTFARREIENAEARTSLRFELPAGGGAVVRFNAKPAAGDLPELKVRHGLRNFHVKASAGGTVRVAFLGGSITAAHGWRVKTREFLQQRYPQAKIEEVFAAIPGSGSPLGVARLQRDVLDRAPDLLFVEFAVNDGGQEPARIERAMEGIVRKLAQARSGADVCFVYTLSKGMVSDYEARRLNPSAAAMERVAAHYGISSVAFGVDVVKQLATGRWVFQADKKHGTHDPEGRTIFSHDGVHPLAAGHALYGEAIVRSWEKLVQGDDPAARELAAPLHSDHWAGAGHMPVAAMSRSGTWQELPADDARVASQPGRIAPPTWWSDTAGSAVEATVTGTVVGLYGFKSAQSGQLRVTIDNLPPVEATLRDTFSTPGHYRLKAWFYPEPLAPGPHRVRVELLPADDQGRGEVFICGVLYSGDVNEGQLP